MHNDIWLFLDNYMYLVYLLNGKYEFDNVDNGNGDVDDDDDDADDGDDDYEDNDASTLIKMVMADHCYGWRCQG